MASPIRPDRTRNNESTGVPQTLAVVRTAAILTGGALALWIAVGVTLNFTVAHSAPAIAEAWWPAGTSAKVARGRQLLTVAQPSPAMIEQTRVSLREAVVREPVNTYALSTLAAIEDYRNDKAGARTLFQLAEAMSRRNIVAQLWLIEDAVGRDRIDEVLVHYDRTMRISIDSRQALLPVLLSAATDPAILKSLLPMLARRPLWWKDYAQRLATTGGDTMVMAASIQAIRPDLRSAEERSLAEGVLRRMIALKDERRAILAANKIEGRRGPARSLRDGDFETSDGLLPFAWWLRDENSVRAYRDSVPNGSMGLWIVSSDASGGAAQQLMGLPSGRYILSGAAGGVPDGPMLQPAVEMSCGNGVSLTRFTLPPSDESGGSFRFRFDIPATNCVTQWVTLVTAPATDSSVWIDNLAITR